ncbi:MAG: 2-hydroxyglutaryl-CoA dehydratase [Chloroflexi bacterium]|nr:2-hydroxyglutaryl-CoA dehydratase [Chloroflexota bacterium]
MRIYLGVDVGSVTTKVVALDPDDNVLESLYLRTRGKPIEVVQQGLREIRTRLANRPVDVAGVGTTGSGRYLAAVVVGADVIKNEITAHAVATSHYVPGVQTIIEIGGQDSKIIVLRDGVAVDFGMNTVCAAGTGAFLDQQAARLNMKIEEVGPLALQSRTPVRIAGRCTVFAESDMIHKQQMGHRVEDILYGLCQAMARNYLNNVGLGKEICERVVFQGGVAYNQGMVRAFEDALETPIHVPPHHEVMGAIGAALLAHETVHSGRRPTRFKGFDAGALNYRTISFECHHCSNRCEIVQVSVNKQVAARWGGRCDRWEVNESAAPQHAGAPAALAAVPDMPDCETCP